MFENDKNKQLFIQVTVYDRIL